MSSRGRSFGPKTRKDPAEAGPKVGRYTGGLQKVGEATMAGKDKGGRAKKTPPSKTAKEKRQAKRDKKAAI
jgi:hypothetical protein